ncbi:MAG: DUF512 domain-containing protein [Christensenellales bacterium]
MRHRIKQVLSGSIAEEMGIEAGDFLLSVNDNPIEDMLDYMYAVAEEECVLNIIKPDGEHWDVMVQKDPEEQIGLLFESDLMSPQRECCNHCVFCFVDQLPPGMRKTLHFKDDDWRLSFIMGNYVTLSNIGKKELNRILHLRPSPLYISVHATDKKVRNKLLGVNAPDPMEVLNALKESQIAFHAQVVLCPGINTGITLEKTAMDLFSLAPYAASLAVVPVGLTGHRKGLHKIKPFDAQTARDAIGIVERLQKEFLRQGRTRFLFASDELYLKAQRPLPPYQSYEDFPQLENGVGLVAKFDKEYKEQLAQMDKTNGEISLVTGEAAYPFMKNWSESLKEYGIKCTVYCIKNEYFGGGIDVAGLVTGTDILRTLHGKKIRGALLLPECMLREKEDVFLDDLTVCDVAHKLGIQIVKTAVNGHDFIRTVFERSASY